MKKTLEEVKTIIIEREQKRRETLAVIDAELTATKNKVNELRASLQNSRTAEEYKTIIHDIRDNEAVIVFFEGKRKEAEKTALTKEEYSHITKEVKEAFEAVKADRTKVIYSSIDKLVKELAAYFKDVDELNGILLDAATVNGRTPLILNGNTLADFTKINDPYHFFIDAYNKMRQAAEIQTKMG